MANDNRNEDQESGFDQKKKDEFGKSQQGATGQQSQQPQSGQQGSIGGQQGQQSEFGQQGQGETSVSERAGQQSGGQQGSPGGFVGSQGQESGEYLQEDQKKQAGFAEQGRGAPEEGRDIERGGERKANRDSDIEGSSENR